MVPKHVIVGLHLTDRFQQAARVQALLTEYGAHIKTRIGLHRTEELGTPQGIILLEIVGDDAGRLALAGKLRDVPGVEVQEIVFEHN
jgi:hypothetical protein